MKKLLLILALVVFFVSCKAQDEANARRLSVCGYYKTTVREKTASILQDSVESSKVQKAFGLVSFLQTEEIRNCEYGTPYYDFSPQRNFANNLINPPKPTVQELKQGDSGHPIAGAAIGAGLGWALVGGPIGLLIGAGVGTVAGSN